jgi:hypothetical protein
MTDIIKDYSTHKQALYDVDFRLRSLEKKRLELLKEPLVPFNETLYARHKNYLLKEKAYHLGKYELLKSLLAKDQAKYTKFLTWNGRMDCKGDNDFVVPEYEPTAPEVEMPEDVKAMIKNLPCAYDRGYAHQSKINVCEQQCGPSANHPDEACGEEWKGCNGQRKLKEGFNSMEKGTGNGNLAISYPYENGNNFESDKELIDRLRYKTQFKRPLPPAVNGNCRAEEVVAAPAFNGGETCGGRMGNNARNGVGNGARNGVGNGRMGNGAGNKAVTKEAFGPMMGHCAPRGGGNYPIRDESKGCMKYGFQGRIGEPFQQVRPASLSGNDCDLTSDRSVPMYLKTTREDDPVLNGNKCEPVQLDVQNSLKKRDYCAGELAYVPYQRAVPEIVANGLGLSTGTETGMGVGNKLSVGVKNGNLADTLIEKFEQYNNIQDVKNMQMEDQQIISTSDSKGNLNYYNAEARPCNCASCRESALDRNDANYLHDSKVVHYFVHPTQQELSKYRHDEMLLDSNIKGASTYRLLQ